MFGHEASSEKITALPPIALTIRGAAAYSGLCIWAVRSAVWAGRLPAKKAGRIILILTTDLDNFVRSLPAVAPLDSPWFRQREDEKTAIQRAA